MRDVYIIGAGMTKFGRHLAESHTALTQASVRAALADAVASPKDIGLAVYANVVQGLMANEHVVPGEFALRPLGISGIQSMHVENACASSTSALQVAYSYIRTGLVDVALVVGTEKLYHEDREKRFAVFNQPCDLEQARSYLELIRDRLLEAPEATGDEPRSVLMDSYAAQARLHMSLFGTTQRQLAAIAAKNHKHSEHNPLAQYQKPMSVEEVLAARTVSWPLTTPMCAPISDGSSAMVLCARENLGRFPDAFPIRIRASVLRSGSDREPDDYEHHVTRLASRAAYEIAGVGPEDMSLAEVHDASSFGEILQTEALGLCPIGEGGRIGEAGETTRGGRIPVNTSGGLVSKGHPLAATGLGQLYELVTQLRGRAGMRQVPDARFAIAENSGGFIGVEDAVSCVTVLAKE
ncbi:MAG: thiolase family protein [Betaproteobacteria bacterium]|nr:thiolase family protein [Betaproteobacteria bacterium]